MASTCLNCGAKLGVGRFLGGKLCGDCSRRQRDEENAAREAADAVRDQARSEYRQQLKLLASSSSPDAVLAELQRLQPAAQVSGGDMRGERLDVFKAFADRVLEDDVLTADEESDFIAVGDALGIDQAMIGDDLRDRLLVARVNDGRLPALTAPNLMTKRGEVVHAEIDAALMKEVKIREYRGGYGGFSFRITKGVSYRTGRTRGQSVVIGTEIQIADTGVLSISSDRAVFIGARSSIEMPYKKLLDINVYSDGIQFHLSNRKSAPLFKIGRADVVAAIVNTAAQNALG
jgi:hypothetical protein